MPASYPSSAKSFTNKTAGQAIDPNHVNDLQLEVAAIENDLVAGLPVARGGTGLTAALPDTRVPYSDGSAFASSSNLTFDGSTFTTAAIVGTTGTFSGALTAQALVDVSGASAGQLKFPATQNASADANTLDDYAEGSFTPSVGGAGGESGQAYSAQVGRYVKIGRLVTCQFTIALSTLGTITGAVQIKGLPFTSENVTQLRAVCAISFANMTSSYTFLGGELVNNATAITVIGMTAAATSVGNLSQADLANTSVLIGTITYRAAA